MNRKLQLFILSLGISAPLLVSAQSLTQGLTREQVRRDAAEYAAAGFNPARMNPRTWVDAAQAASAKVMTARANTPASQLVDNQREDGSNCN